MRARRATVVVSFVARRYKPMNGDVPIYYACRPALIRVCARLVLVFAFAEGAPALAASTSYPVPQGAFDVGHSSISPGRIGEDRFSIRLAFPSTDVIEHYRRYFSRFIECRGRGTAWEAGPDPSTPPKFIHQLVKIWVTEEDREIITLAIRYASSGSDWRDRPDNDLQEVTVLYERVINARQAARAKGTSCDDAPVPARRPPQPGPTIMR